MTRPYRQIMLGGKTLEPKAAAIRPANEADADVIASIYNEAIEERQSTFETRLHSAEDFAGPIRHGQLCLVVEDELGHVLGWARLSAHSARDCYAGVGEASVYVARRHRGRGLGRALFDALADAAASRGYWKLIGLLFATNQASLALCRAVGCREVGVFRRHSRLDGAWRDVTVVEKLVGEAATDR
jgi:L-amino acid N-acyltransferase YncA